MPRSGSRSLRRRPSRLNPRPRVLIVCEGEVTEPEYFRGIKVKDSITLVDITIAHKSSDPLSVVREAISRKRKADEYAARVRDDNERFDEIWCVFDVDSHKTFATATELASRNGVQVAVSNPCFEVWLLLHFGDQHAPLTPKIAKATCGRHIPNYCGKVPFDLLWPGYHDAVKRATHLDQHQAANGTPGANPSTRVHLVCERLRQLGRDQLLRQHLGATGRR